MGAEEKRIYPPARCPCMEKLLLLLGLVILVAGSVMLAGMQVDLRVYDGETCSSGSKSMTWAEARGIAESSECGSRFEGAPYCNENTGTWWIDLPLERQGCSPACVVDVATGTAEINWRCTGLLTD
jgi:hypothetical protein